MKLDRFRHLSEAYGADMDRWPKSERDEARALASGSLEAKRLLADARTLDRLLQAASAPDDIQLDRMIARIEMRIDAEAAAAPPPRMPPFIPAASFRSGFLGRATAFVVAMGLCGVVTGHLVGPTQGTDQQSAGLSSLVEPSSVMITWLR